MKPSRKPDAAMNRAIAEMLAARVEISVRFERDVRNLAHEGGLAVACRIGCAHCCSYPLVTSLLEGLTAYRSIAETGLWTPSLRKRVEEMADKTQGLAYEVWLLADIPCPLLDDKRCIIYTGRPLTCRLSYNVGDAYYCHPHRLGQASSIVGRVEPLKEFHAAESRILKTLGAHHLLLPFARAILFGARIAAGEIQPSKLNNLLVEELRHGG